MDLNGKESWFGLQSLECDAPCRHGFNKPCEDTLFRNKVNKFIHKGMTETVLGCYCIFFSLCHLSCANTSTVLAVESLCRAAFILWTMHPACRFVTVKPEFNLMKAIHLLSLSLSLLWIRGISLQGRPLSSQLSVGMWWLCRLSRPLWRTASEPQMSGCR